jgi:hypothetical protein
METTLPFDTEALNGHEMTMMQPSQEFHFPAEFFFGLS